MSLQTDSTRTIAFHSDFYCIGFDTNKVKSGQQDNREMRSVDSSKPWNPGLLVCKKIFYSDVNLTKEQAIKENDELWNYPVIS